MAEDLAKMKNGGTYHEKKVKVLKFEEEKLLVQIQKVSDERIELDNITSEIDSLQKKVKV